MTTKPTERKDSAMTTVQVTISVPVRGLPDAAARDYARSIVERRGLTVDSTSIKRTKTGDWAGYTPKSGKPGSQLNRDGRSYQVWADAHCVGCVWALPLNPQEDDAPIYMIDTRRNYSAVPYTLLGQRWSKPVAA